MWRYVFPRVIFEPPLVKKATCDHKQNSKILERKLEMLTDSHTNGWSSRHHNVKKNPEKALKYSELKDSQTPPQTD